LTNWFEPPDLGDLS